VFHYRTGEEQVTRQLAIGAVVAFRAAMKMLADEADLCAKSGEERGLDLAHFDCYACHHALKVPSWRQKRGFVGAPGRSQVRPWPIPLTRAVIQHADTVAGRNPTPKRLAELDAGLQSLTAVFSRRPFGQPALVKKAAADLVEWSEAALHDLEAVRYSKEESERLLQLIVAAAATRPEKLQDAWLDQDGAQQMVWASEVLRPLTPEDRRARVNDALTAVEKSLPRHVRSGKGVEWLEPVLAARLERLYGFDLDQFRTPFEKLRGEWKPSSR
jgi:hypothetical protein